MKNYALVLLALFMSCNNDDEPAERITKLRGIGVSASPAIVMPSTDAAKQIVDLTFYAAVPLGQTITSAVYNDPSAVYSAAFPVTIVAGSEEYKDHNALRIYSIRAQVPIPTNDVLHVTPDTPRKVRYGLEMKVGAEDEKIVGDVFVFAPGSEQLKWGAPKIAMGDIPDPGAGSEVDINGSITKTEAEDYRVGWFVSGGSVKNRRAAATKWQTPGAGKHTVIFTARGLKSKAFAMEIKDVEVK